MGRDRSPEQVPDQVGDWNKRWGREAPPLVVCAAGAGPRSSRGWEVGVGWCQSGSPLGGGDGDHAGGNDGI